MRVPHCPCTLGQEASDQRKRQGDKEKTFKALGLFVHCRGHLMWWFLCPFPLPRSAGGSRLCRQVSGCRRLKAEMSTKGDLSYPRSLMCHEKIRDFCWGQNHADLGKCSLSAKG